MINQLSKDASLVSIIIPCYNHSHYLPVAIESVLKQTYLPLEIIVIDDGSTDNTREVAESYPQVTYIFQINQGLSASRNAGIIKSRGLYLVFLDADDWLYPDAIKINLGYLLQHKNAAYVSGAYDRVDENKNMILECKNEIAAQHYRHLLIKNFVGVPAAVMYRRWVFGEFLFDTSLKACEDYDLYLKISRKYPIIHHTEKIAAYRKHSSNISLDFRLMLSSSLQVLHRQKELLKDNYEIQAYKKGHRFWKKHYARELYHQLRSGKTKISAANLYFLLKNKSYFFFRFLIVYPLRKLFSQKINLKNK
jgi:glycosyltransferase involved in cell wall biosynthesis